MKPTDFDEGDELLFGFWYCHPDDRGWEWEEHPGYVKDGRLVMPGFPHELDDPNMHTDIVVFKVKEDHRESE